jgi:hypothetical protein
MQEANVVGMSVRRYIMYRNFKGLGSFWKVLKKSFPDLLSFAPPPKVSMQNFLELYLSSFSPVMWDKK